LPLLPGEQAKPKASVVHPQVTVGAGDDDIGNDLGDLLRHHANVKLVAPEMTIAVEVEAILKPPDRHDVALKARCK
jgi:hypothetical protein